MIYNTESNVCAALHLQLLLVLRSHSHWHI